MTNVEIIKKYFLPLLVTKEDNAYKAVFLTAWKSSFIKTILMLDSKNSISRLVLDNTSFEKAIDRYSEIINNWQPNKTLKVFWIEGISVYTFNQYAVLKEFFKVYNSNLYNCLINKKSTDKDSHKDTLLKLALNGDLTDKQYKKFEKIHVDFVRDQKANMDDFKILYNVAKVYNSNVIWENYLNYHKTNQIFLHSVKDFFEKNQVKYQFQEEEIDIFIKSKFTRTLYLDPEYICQNNQNITTSTVDNVMRGIIEYYLKMAKEVQYNITIDANDYKSAHTQVMIHFDKISLLAIYEEKIENFNQYLKAISENLLVEKNKLPEQYTENIDKLYRYYTMEKKFDNKEKEKKLKI